MYPQIQTCEFCGHNKVCSFTDRFEAIQNEYAKILNDAENMFVLELRSKHFFRVENIRGESGELLNGGSPPSPKAIIGKDNIFVDPTFSSYIGGGLNRE